jgi:putative aldouronate transport system substrate-binding protein
MKKARLVLLWLLVTVFVLGSLTGCASNTGDTTKAGSDGGKAPASEKKEHMEISIALWDLQDFGEDELGKIIEDKLNITIKEVNLSWDTAGEQTKLFAATGDMPDCVASYTVSDPTRFYEWINQGITRSIPEEIIDRYPLTKQMIENSRCLQAVKDIKGAYYFIPRPESVMDIHIATQMAIYYRKDWMENVGIAKEPETMDEFYLMLRAFKEDDPDGNGKNDTIGLTIDKLKTELFAAYGVDPRHWIEEDGRFIPGFMSRKNIEPLKFYQKIYREGILDPEFAKNGYKEALGKLAKNTAGAMLRNADVSWLKGTIMDYYGDANEDKGDPLKLWGVLGPLRKDENSDPAWPMFVSTCGTEIASHVTDEKLDRIMELVEFLISPEGRELMRWGIEGVDFEIVDGEYKSLLSEDETLGIKYPSVRLKSFSDWDFDFAATLAEEGGSPLVPDEYKILGVEVRGKYNPWARQERLDVSYLSTPAKDSLTIDWGGAFTQIITGSDDVEKAFDVFIQDCINKGVENAITEVNQIVDSK